MVDISVIIVTIKNRDDILPIPHFENSDFSSYEVIIRDDSGICTARNRGIKEAESDKILFIDDDAIPREGYLSTAANLLEDNPVISGRVIQPEDSPVSNLKPANYDYGDTPQKIDEMQGCNMGLRREVFETVGMFDERFDWGHDETELAQRIRERFPIRYSPELVVEHSYADSHKDYLMKKYKLGIADVRWWRKDNIQYKQQLSRIFGPGGLTVESPLLFAGGVMRKFGQIKELQKLPSFLKL